MSTQTRPRNDRVQRHTRIRYTLDVGVRADLIQDRATSHNISAGGIFVDTAQDYLPGMPVELRFTVDLRKYHIPAKVIHVSEQVGFGAMFTDMSPSDREHLLRFVHRQRAIREAERAIAASRASE